MAFLLTANIKIGLFKPVKPNAIKWQRSITEYSDSAMVKIPAISRLKKNGEVYDRVPTGLQITEGMPITIEAGYDGKNAVRFKGFVKRINFTVPLELECEGYSYQLRKKYFTKSYKTTTLKEVLTDLVSGTDIKLSSLIPTVPLKNLLFRNVNGCEVLDYFKSKCLMTIYFNYDELYAGIEQAEAKTTIKHRLGWNVVADNELKFEANKELATVTISVEQRSKAGHRQHSTSSGPKDGSVKVLKLDLINDPATRARIAEAERKKLLQRGYEGKITAFLVPIAEPGMADEIDDKRYPERTAKYFITGVDGSLDTSGGRQRISIGRTL